MPKHKLTLNLDVAVDDIDPQFCDEDCMFLSGEWHMCRLFDAAVELIDLGETRPDYKMYLHKRCSSCVAPKQTALEQAFHEAAGAFQQLAAAVEIGYDRDQLIYHLNEARERFRRARDKARKL